MSVAGDEQIKRVLNHKLNNKLRLPTWIGCLGSKVRGAVKSGLFSFDVCSDMHVFELNPF